VNFDIRLYQPDDLHWLYKICLLTGDSGKDASGQLSDEILGHYYAAPYPLFQPELCFTLLESGLPCGYLVGTSDSASFADFINKEWLPTLLERYPLPGRDVQTREASMVRQLHTGYTPPACTINYPAHLHINVLPIGQGQGTGKKMMDVFTKALQSQSVPGLHLNVSVLNPRAIEFYKAYGFVEVDRANYAITYGLVL
jgi:ribosomal protein S18 acetylase RimI-like enzyme